MNLPIALALLLLSATAPALAAPDFSTSTIAPEPGVPLEGDLVTYTVTVRNSGADPGQPVVLITPPAMGMFVDADGGGVSLEQTDQSLLGGFALEPGAERTLRFRVVAPNDAGGLTLSAALQITDYPTKTEHRVWSETEVDTRPGSGGLAVGGVRIAPAGLVVLAILALWVLGLLAARMAGLRRAARPVTAIAIALGFWVLFAALAWRDWRSLHAWTETTCTVLARRIDATTVSSSSSRPAERSRARSEVFQPILALGYAVDGRAMVSTGFDTGTRLSIGGFGGAAETIERFVPGAEVPCWFDPDAPRDVVVVPGFGGAYVFALFPLPVLLLGIGWLRAARAE